jgi:hypothetical protein
VARVLEADPSTVSEATVLRAAFTHGWERLHEQALEIGYAELAASETEETQAERVALTARRNRMYGHAE